MRSRKRPNNFTKLISSWCKAVALSVSLIVFAIADAPDWSVNSGDYSSNLSLIGSFYYNDEPFDGLNMVGAFDADGDVRGVATGTVYGSDYLYLITIYGYGAIENISFKAWIADGDTILSVDETIQFVPDGTVGTVGSPSVFNAYLDYDFVPTLSGIPDQSIHMGEEFGLILLSDYLSVGDEDDILYSTTQGTYITVSQAGEEVEILAADNWIGTESIVFTATELTSNGYFASDTAAFTVLREDNPPVFDDIPNQMIGSNGTLASIDLMQNLTELDGDSLSFSMTYGLTIEEDEDPSWEVNSLDFEFSMNAVISMHSRNEIPQGTEHTLAAFDAEGNVRGLTSGVEYGDGWLYLITIYSNNIGEQISFRFYNNSTLQNIPVEETVTFENDGVLGTPSYPMNLNASFIKAQISTDGLVVLSRTDASWSGTDSLFFHATDTGTLNNYTTSDTVTITVQGGYAPILSGIPDQSIDIGSSFASFDLSDYLETSDEDDVLFSFSGNVDLQVSLNGSLVDINMAFDWSGSENVIFTATDDNVLALASSDTVTFTVVPVDNPPSLSNVPDQNIDIDETFTPLDLTSYLTELDGDELSWDFRFLSHPNEANDPIWSVSSSSFLYSMTLVADVESLGEVKESNDHRLAAIDHDGQTVGVSQASSYQDSWIYSLTIYSNEEHPNIDLYFYDADAQRVLLVDMNVEFYNGLNLGSPLEPQRLRAGPFFIDIDEQGIVTTDILQKHWEYPETIRFTVADLNTNNNYSFFYDVSYMIDNRTPELTLSDRTINEGGNFSSISLHDFISDDGTTYDSLSINISVDSIYTVEMVNDTILTIYPPEDIDWNGTLPVSFTITDHHPYHSETLNSDVLFTMLPVNDAPIIDQAMGQSIVEDASGTFSFVVTDVDTGETLILSTFSDTNSVALVADSDDYTVTTSQDTNWHGSSEITVVISDGELTDTTAFTLVVEPVNDAPTIVQAEDQSISEEASGTFSFEVADVDTGTTLILSTFSDTSAVTLVADSDDYTVTTSQDTNWHGSSEISVVVSDGDLMDTTTFTLTVVPINDAPVLSFISDVVIDENDSLLLDLQFVDVDTGEVFTLFASTNSSSILVSVNDQDSSLTAIPDADWHGSVEITVIVSDGELYDTQTFTLTVVPVNDAPTIVDIEDQTILEDGLGTFFFEVADIDTGSILTLAVLADTSAVTVESNPVEYSITALPDTNWHGSANITAIVSDGRLADTTYFLLTVDPVNDRPHISEMDDQSIPEDGSGTYVFEVSDIDTGETLILTAFSDVSTVNATTNSADTTVTIFADENWYGECQITVVVSDGELTDTSRFGVTVYPVDNDSPIIIDADDQTILEDQSGTFSFEVSDLDTGDVLVLTTFSDTIAVTVIPNSDNFTITTSQDTNWHGSSEITVIVSDEYYSDSTSFILTVDPVNDAPVISPIPDAFTEENNALYLNLELTDVDTGETFIIFASSDDPSLTVTADPEDSSITAIPDADWHGSSEITVIVSDGELSDTQTFTLTVGPINDAPTIADIEDITIHEDENLILQVQATDIDTGQVLILSAFSDTSSVLVEPDSDNFTITTSQDTNWHGSSEITIVVSDGSLADTTSFRLLVLPVNDAPIIASLSDTSISENTVYQISLQLSDVDTGEVFLLFASSSDPKLAVSADPEDSSITAIPDADWHGFSDVTIILSDGNMRDTTSFRLTVDPVNDSPLIADLPDQSISEDRVGLFAFEVTDIDTGTTLILSAYTDTSSVTVFSNSDDFTISTLPDTNWHGSTDVTVIISDGLLTDTTVFTLVVYPINDAPVIADVEDISILEDNSMSVTFEVLDVDTGEVLILHVLSDTNAVSSIINGEDHSVILTPDTNWYGLANIVAIIDDGELTDTTTFSLDVENVSDQPYSVLGEDIFCMQGQNVRIDGSGSYDIDNESLTYFWTVSGILDDTLSSDSSFLSILAPDLDVASNFLVSLGVENENGLRSEPDSLLLFVEALEINDIISDEVETVVQAGQDVPVSVNLPEYFIVDSISLNYSSAFSGFISREMESQNSRSRSGSSYSSKIPYHDVGTEGLAYFIYAEDLNGSELITDTVDIALSFKEGIVSSDMTYSPYADGFPKNAWRMISIPSYTSDNQVNDIFDGQLGEAPRDESWRLYEVGSYGWSSPDSIKVGKGYWLKQMVKDNPNFTIDSGTTVELTGFDIELASGWNLISSPYLFPVAYKMDPPSVPELFIYGSDTLEGWMDSIINTMVPWTAYAAYNGLGPRTIRVSPLNSSDEPVARQVQKERWYLNILARSGRYVDGMNRFGISLGAQKAIDSLNIPEPQPIDKHISLSSIHKRARDTKELTHDIRSQSDSLISWNLTLKSNGTSNQEGLFRFSLHGDLGRGVLKFVNMQNGDILDIGTIHENDYYFNMNPAVPQRSFQLLYGNEAEVEQALDDILTSIPREFSLGDNYPNPFNPSTNIPFAISSPDNASLIIYDITGRQVRSILNQFLGVGYHSAIWDGRNDNGNLVSSGVYYYELRTSAFRNFKKMIFIK